MAFFEYTARNKSGGLVHGSIEAADKAAAANSIFEKNLTPVTITGQSEHKLGLNFSLFKRKKVPLTEKVIFSRQFATMIGAGVPIVKALAILKGQTQNRTMAEALTSITKQVEGGTQLSAALAKFPDIFSPTFVNMVKAGEAGGILEQVLDRLAVQLEKDHELVGKVKAAMIYPSVIFVVMTAAFFFIMTFIVPQLAVVFDQLGGKLPWYTKFLLGLSKVLTHYGFLLIIPLVALIIGFWRFKRTPAGKHLLDRVLLKTPLIGNIIRKVNLAHFARTLGSLMGAGLAVLDALNVVAQSLSNSVIAEEVLDVAQVVKNGSTIAKPLQTSKNFPPIVSEMVAVGEETGTLDQILIKLAEFYEKEVSALVEGISSVIEPILIIFMGGMVGFIVISVIGPLYQLTNSV